MKERRGRELQRNSPTLHHVPLRRVRRFFIRSCSSILGPKRVDSGPLRPQGDCQTKAKRGHRPGLPEASPCGGWCKNVLPSSIYRHTDSSALNLCIYQWPYFFTILDGEGLTTCGLELRPQCPHQCGDLAAVRAGSLWLWVAFTSLWYCSGHLRTVQMEDLVHCDLSIRLRQWDVVLFQHTGLDEGPVSWRPACCGMPLSELERRQRGFMSGGLPRTNMQDLVIYCKCTQVWVAGSRSCL